MMDPWVDASKIIQVDVRAVNYEQTTISTDANMIRAPDLWLMPQFYQPHSRQDHTMAWSQINAATIKTIEASVAASVVVDDPQCSCR